jgi:FO synthase
MNESISRAAGTRHGQEMPPEAMRALINSLGRTPRQRNTLYGPVDDAIQARGLIAKILDPVVQTPPRKRAKILKTSDKKLEIVTHGK